MKLPDFLIIGAMKAGTTTLYEDLLAVPGLWLPPHKEPQDLIDPGVETAQGRAGYGQKYAACPPGALAGDASTAYAKRPTHSDVAPRAARVLGCDTRIIYLIRDPVQRIVSQYHHLWGLEIEQRPLNRAVLEDPQYIAYSRYDWQLVPWRATFGSDNILVLRFEEYLADRQGTVARICAFLGVAPPATGPDATAPHRNQSEGKRVVKSGSRMQRLAQSRFYLFTVKPLIPTRLRDRVKAALLPRARAMSETLDDATRAQLHTALRDDPLARNYLP